MGVGALRWWCGLCSLAVRETGVAFAGLVGAARETGIAFAGMAGAGGETGVAFAGMVGAGGETRVAFAGVNGPVLGGWSRAMVLWVSCRAVWGRVVVRPGVFVGRS